MADGRERGGRRQVSGAMVMARLLFELSAHGRQGHFFLISEALDLEDELYVGGSINAVAGFAAVGTQDLTPALPVAQYVGSNAGDAAYLTDGVILLLGNIPFHKCSPLTGEGARDRGPPLKLFISQPHLSSAPNSSARALMRASWCRSTASSVRVRSLSR